MKIYTFDVNMCTNFNAVAEKAAFGTTVGMMEIAKHLINELKTRYPS